MRAQIDYDRVRHARYLLPTLRDATSGVPLLRRALERAAADSPFALEEAGSIPGG